MVLKTVWNLGICELPTILLSVTGSLVLSRTQYIPEKKPFLSSLDVGCTQNATQSDEHSPGLLGGGGLRLSSTFVPVPSCPIRQEQDTRLHWTLNRLNSIMFEL